jgi:Bacterial protein of unknown function (DUF839)/Malectin domain
MEKDGDYAVDTRRIGNESSDFVGPHNTCDDAPTDTSKQRCSYGRRSKLILALLVVVGVVVSLSVVFGKKESDSPAVSNIESSSKDSSTASPRGSTDGTTPSPPNGTSTTPNPPIGTSSVLIAKSESPSIPPLPYPSSSPVLSTSMPVRAVSSSFQPIRINAGGFSYIDSQNNSWVSDEPYRSTGKTYNGTCPQDATDTVVDRTLYCSGRVHVQGYEIPVPNGNYATTLHFFYGSLDVAAFGIYIEGGLAYSAAGNDTLFVVDVPATTVTDGVLSIGFTNASFSIRISALEVHAAPETAGNDHNATAAPDVSPVVTTNVTYSPGLLMTEMAGLRLSQGLTARLIATSKQRVEYANGSFSSLVFHDKPDAGATYVDTRPFNVGGWIYVSNSEADLNTTFPGGVGAITFDAAGNVIDYRSVLDGSFANCGGGRTPWGSWISGEERKNGGIFQVDPTGERLGVQITMGNTYRGRFESFAHDIRNRDIPRFFMTKDDLNGELRRL